MDIEYIAHEYGNIEKIIDLDTTSFTREVEMEDAVDALTTGLKAVAIADQKKVKKYGPDQIRRFMELVQEEGMSIPKAAVQAMIPRSSAYKLFNEYNAGTSSVMPGPATKGKNRGTPQKLFDEHATALTKIFDSNPSCTLGLAAVELANQFDGLTVSLPTLWEFITEKCAMSLKQATVYTAERDSSRTIELRHKIVSEWKAAGVDFKKNCVFIDEAGFNSHMIRGRAWSKVGEPASVKVHTRRGLNLSLVGCISPFGTINFSKVEPLVESDAEKIEREFAEKPNSKKRKANTQEASKPKPLKKGTTAYHIVKFMEAVMDVLDKHNKKGLFIVMDNCRIHHSHFVVDAINKRGYKPLFMPPYSPFLNP